MADNEKKAHIGLGKDELNQSVYVVDGIPMTMPQLIEYQKEQKRVRQVLIDADAEDESLRRQKRIERGEALPTDAAKEAAYQAGLKNSTKSDSSDELKPWTDEELDAMSSDISEQDIKRSLATRTPEMRKLLSANTDESTE